jgi:hypothetical protein
MVGVMWTRPIIGADNCVYRDKRLLRRASSDQTVVLIDQSEALTDTHRRFALGFIKDYVADDATFSVRSRIALFTFSKLNFETPNSPPSFRPRSDLCRPPSQGNELYENNRKITKDFYVRFLLPVTSALEQSLSVDVGERSPILETLQLISRSQEIEDGGRKTLIVVSDMLQNTPGFSHYRDRRSYGDFVRSGFASDVKADFRDWSIIVIYLRRYRDRHLQQGAHVDFWQRYFHDAGGKVTRWAGVD